LNLSLRLVFPGFSCNNKNSKTATHQSRLNKKTNFRIVKSSKIVKSIFFTFHASRQNCVLFRAKNGFSRQKWLFAPKKFFLRQKDFYLLQKYYRLLQPTPLHFISTFFFFLFFAKVSSFCPILVFQQSKTFHFFTSPSVPIAAGRKGTPGNRTGRTGIRKKDSSDWQTIRMSSCLRRAWPEGRKPVADPAPPPPRLPTPLRRSTGSYLVTKLAGPFRAEGRR
jgi:hypothetical protein